MSITVTAKNTLLEQTLATELRRKGYDVQLDEASVFDLAKSAIDDHADGETLMKQFIKREIGFPRDDAKTNYENFKKIIQVLGYKSYDDYFKAELGPSLMKFLMKDALNQVHGDRIDLLKKALTKK